MFDKAHGLRSIGIAVAGVICGVTPVATQAIEGPQPNAVFVAQAGGCGPLPGPKPFALAVEPRAEAVKNAPYSGVGTTEVVTTLADGNRIVRTNTMKYYRDSRGRTRTEYSLAAIGPFTPEQAQTVVTIADPVEGRRYVLHSALKRADVFPLSAPGIAAKAAAVAAAKGSANGYAPKVVFGTFGTATGVMPEARAGSTVAGPSGTPPSSASAPETAAGFGPAPGTAIAPPVVVMSSAAVLPPANAGFIMQYAAPVFRQDGCEPNAKPLPSPTSLGERIIEGLKVTGTRMEFTIEAGAVGNELPIRISSEQWFSPDLGVVVSSTHRDPMMGDTTYRLEQISRAEPAPSLFTVPADYTQNDVTASGGVFFESNAGVPPPPGAPPMGAGGGGSFRLQATPSKPAGR